MRTAQNASAIKAPFFDVSFFHCCAERAGKQSVGIPDMSLQTSSHPKEASLCPQQLVLDSLQIIHPPCGTPGETKKYVLFSAQYEKPCPQDESWYSKPPVFAARVPRRRSWRPRPGTAPAVARARHRRSGCHPRSAPAPGQTSVSGY